MIKKILFFLIVGGIGYIIFIPPLLQEIKSDINGNTEASILEFLDTNTDQQNQSDSTDDEL